MKSYPIVAIVGRPNVGKSTLFNSLVGERRAIVSDIAGTTRDSVTEKIDNLGPITYWAVDTAGLTDFGDNSLETAIQVQAELALHNADMILWMVDAKVELTQDDYDIADKLRRVSKKVLFVANKIDDGQAMRGYELAELGFGVPAIISAKNNFGFWDLTEVIQERLQELGFEPIDSALVEAPERIKVALVGRPNVGKSTLFNQMIGEERSVVSDVAGTTRDAIDTDWTSPDGTQFRFIDTAGVRRPGKIGREMEYWMVVRTRQAIERADVCILLLDALDGVTHQDLALAGQIVDAGKALLIGVNKFDLARDKSRTNDETDDRELEAVPMWDKDIADIRSRYLSYLHNKISFLPWAPVLFFSAQNGKGTDKILESLISVNAERSKRVPTRELNLLAKDIYYGHVTPSHGLKQGKIKYVSQVDTSPPKFLFFVNNIQAFHFSYKRYMENKIREKYGFAGTPIIVELKDAMASWRARGEEEKED
ncbi:ribosome biogenesis GTPase Der [bacterium]|nr:ribosome biogenesis GTPase Der [bacterium]NCQ54797.1 ribosome biogenesis GTPase Der [Candidatus Parcubacteria bacterium]NCS66841.1 ribosome biogenesis GTPase Der [Candidatus Peregrinibacteria bacterium]NCS95787.1 ribosome biogenesis GTPase Der [bacterium]